MILFMVVLLQLLYVKFRVMFCHNLVKVKCIFRSFFPDRLLFVIELTAKKNSQLYKKLANFSCVVSHRFILGASKLQASFSEFYRLCKNLQYIYISYEMMHFELAICSLVLN